MIFDPFTQQPIYNSGFWQNSQCIINENLANKIIKKEFAKYGFTFTKNSKLWTGKKQIAMSLVDDIRTINNDYETDISQLFSKDIIIITDNHIINPIDYQINQLPSSFFGIYFAGFNEFKWNPNRQFCFSVNRIDYRRLQLLIEICNSIDIDQGYINFNCQTAEFSNVLEVAPPPTQLKENFKQHWDQLKINNVEMFNFIESKMPLKNYSESHEEIHTMSWLNIIVESYSSDDSVVFSEKIFRALQLPVPWVLYGGRTAVAYLESLGFDCLSDIIDHSTYDKLHQSDNKIEKFIDFSMQCIPKLQQVQTDLLQQRCQLACKHNQLLLSTWQKTWQQDLKDWSNSLAGQLVQ